MHSTQPKRIIILGIGGNCVDILEAIFDINEQGARAVYEPVGFLDDNPETKGNMIQGVPILGPLSSARDYTGCRFVNGIGSVNNYWKKLEIIQKTNLTDDCFETIVHPTASISRTATLGSGVVILPNVTVASNAMVGKHVMVLANSVINHNSVVGDGTILASSVTIAGNVHIGRGCYFGSNSAIRDGITIEDYCLIGMGSTVIRSVETRSVVAGNPARLIRKI
jgi:sugar O-acyltransferase (sialic acid O-acetyltransferase NeuD family)